MNLLYRGIYISPKWKLIKIFCDCKHLRIHLNLCSVVVKITEKPHPFSKTPDYFHYSVTLGHPSHTIQIIYAWIGRFCFALHSNWFPEAPEWFCIQTKLLSVHFTWEVFWKIFSNAELNWAYLTWFGLSFHEFSIWVSNFQNPFRIF